MANETVKVAYVMGSGRSGSTLLDLLLGQVPGFFSIGELNCMLFSYLVEFHHLCTCGSPYTECEFWRPVFEQLYGGFEGFPRQEYRADYEAANSDAKFLQHATGLRGAALTAHMERFTGELQRIYTTIQAQAGCKVIVDSSKATDYALNLAATPGIELHLIHLVRDPRAVSHSWTRRRKRPEVLDEEVYLYQYPLWVSAAKWLKHNTKAALVGQKVGRYLRVRYEDLAQEPEAELRRILAFLGEDCDELPFIRGKELDIPKTHNVLGNPMRFGKSGMTVRLDDAWRQRLTPGQRRLVTAITLPLMAAYGYRP